MEPARTHPGVRIDPAVEADLEGATIRSGTVIYPGVSIGSALETGHNAVIRSGTALGDNVLVGTNAVIEGEHVAIGDGVRLQTGAFIPTHTTIARDVFIGPNVTLTNDTDPTDTYEPDGPTIYPEAVIGANATVLPGVKIGARAFVAAGSVVTSDVPNDHVAMGVPAEVQEP